MIQVRRQARFLLSGIALALLAACAGDVDHLAVREQVGDARVVLLSTEWCGYCRRLRGDLAGWGVAYAEFDVEHTDEGRSAYHLVGGRGVPILLVGDQVVHGYAPQRARELISASGLAAASD